MSNRTDKLNSLFCEELGALISRYVDFKPGVFATVSSVKVSDDLTLASIFLQCYPTSEENYVLKTLENEKSKLLKELSSTVKIKKLPKMQFMADRQGELVDTMTEIFNTKDY